MFFSSLFFILWRLTEITFLIPIIGMLAYFVHGFVSANMLTPSYILVLFITSVIAIFWCLDTLIRLGTTKRSAIFVAFVDLCFFGALIAGVYQLAFISNADCGNFSNGKIIISLGPFGVLGYSGNVAPNLNKTCSMLKASFALGIMEVVFFFGTACFAAMLHRNREVVEETVVRRRSHSNHRGHHRRGSSSRRSHYVV